MNPFDSVSVLADLIFGLVMLVYGFAGGLFVAGWVLVRSQRAARWNTLRSPRAKEGGK
jgi:hypothetical protein